MSGPSISMLERLFNVVRELTLTNILMIALLLLLTVPAYFAYRFLTDEKFRSEFMEGATVLDNYVPCIVLEAHAYGRSTRHTVVAVYALDGRFEKLLGMRAPGKLTNEEIGTVCQVILSEAAKISRMREGEPKP